MADRKALRRSVLDGLLLPSRVGLVDVSDAGPVTRFIYRGPSDLPASGLGVPLPTSPMRAHVEGERSALWLGPDEWLLLLGETDDATLAAELHGASAALVDVSHRQVGLVVSGQCAATLLNAGCPLDLDASAFPVGMCTRTILGKAEIVLWRTGGQAFRVEVARSFAPYVVAFLAEAMHGLD